MDSHRTVLQAFLDNAQCKSNSKILSKDKYDSIVHVLKSGDDGVSAKMKWTVKKKGFALVNFPELNLHDVLCVPAKKQNENDPTILSAWRIQTHSDNIVDIVMRLHWSETNHIGYKKLLTKMQSRYEGIPRSIVQEACRSCPVCLMSVRQTNNAELKPILSSGFLTRAQIDLIDMRHKPDGDFKYIAHFMDHWSKFHIIWPMKKKTAEEVANGLNERVFPYVGLPRILHSDNGREFVNQLVRELVKDWGGENDVLFINGRPRHSQSQGLVEQGNATIERHIANKRATLSLEGNEQYPWVRWLPRIAYCMNTEVATGINKMPYEVVFGQPPRTTIFPGARVNGNVINEEDVDIEVRETTDPACSFQQGTPKKSEECSQGRPTPTPRRSRIHTDTGDVDMPLKYSGTISATTVTSVVQGTVNELLAKETPKKTDEGPQERPTPTPRRRRNHADTSDIQPLTTANMSLQTTSASAGVSLEASPGPSLEEVAFNEDSALSSLHGTSQKIDECPQARPIPRPRRQIQLDTSDVDTNSSTSAAPFLTTTTKHAPVRAEAEQAYRRNAEMMKLKYAKRKRTTFQTFEVGDMVTIKIPRIDRSCTDKPRLKGKVVATKGEVDTLYQVQCEFGIIRGWYRGGDLMPYHQGYQETYDNSKKVSVREASSKINPNIFYRKKCACKTSCAKNCFCVRSGLSCSSHCHPSRTCKNTETSQLGLAQRTVVSDGNSLTDEHMTYAQSLLRKQFPNNHGLKDTLLTGQCKLMETPYIQIFHVHGNHWVTASANSREGPLYVYDSLCNNGPDSATLKQFRSYHGTDVKVSYMNVQQQTGSSDCGLFALAFAAALCIGDDPTAIFFRQAEMREHFLNCTEEGNMSMFPHYLKAMNRRRRHVRVKFSRN